MQAVGYVGVSTEGQATEGISLAAPAGQNRGVGLIVVQADAKSRISDHQADRAGGRPPYAQPGGRRGGEIATLHLTIGVNAQPSCGLGRHETVRRHLNQVRGRAGQCHLGR